MPVFSSRIAGSPYGYSGTRLTDLEASEYTLVAIAADQSGSVAAFRADIERCLGEVVRAARGHARADRVMVRLTAFDNALHEVHGFVPVPRLDPDRYAGCLSAGGATALYDAAHNAVAALTSYGDTLHGADVAVNGLVLVLTDGEDNMSSQTAADVQRALDAAVASERLDGLHAMLVGVGVGGSTSQALMRFSAEAGFHDYIAIEQADATSLQRLARFASRSIAVQSTALGTGAKPASLVF